MLFLFENETRIDNNRKQCQVDSFVGARVMVVVDGGEDVALIAQPLNRFPNLVLSRQSLASLDNSKNMKPITRISVHLDGADDLQ